ncbi:MAG: cell envelope integrity protein TolA [Legionella sp.]
MQDRSYHIALVVACFLHLSIALVLLIEPSTSSVAQPIAKSDTSMVQPTIAPSAEVEPIKAVSVDSQEVMDVVNRIKEQRLLEKQAEEKRQLALKREAQQAQQRRIAEQQRLEKLKAEAAKLALARKKALAEEQRRLQELAKEKEKQEKQLADIKKQQEKAKIEQKKQEQANKLAEQKRKKAEELAKVAKANEEKSKADDQLKRNAAIQQAKADADKNAQMAGIVDKYKSLIISAIGRQWILPENVDSNMSSQFRIRLAPNGAVLEVTLTRSSGDPILDRSAQSAIYKASPLPVPTDADAFNVFRDISLTVRPQSVRG